jgi:putative Mn2+ efflux pump MntP
MKISFATLWMYSVGYMLGSVFGQWVGYLGENATEHGLVVIIFVGLIHISRKLNLIDE